MNTIPKNDDVFEECFAHFTEGAELWKGDDLFITLIYPPQTVQGDSTDRGFAEFKALEDTIRKRREAQGLQYRGFSDVRLMPGGDVVGHLILEKGTETPDSLAALWPHGPVSCVPLSEFGAPEDVIASLFLG